MRRIPLRQSISLLIAVISIIILLLIIFVTMPVVFRISNLSGNIQETQAFLESQYEKSRQLKRSVSELPEAITKAAKFSAAYTAPDTEVDTIRLMERLAAEHNIKQSLNISFREQGVAAPKRELTLQYRKPHYELSLLATGRFSDLMRYLDTLEKMPMHIIIDNVALSQGAADEEGVTTVNLRFNARIFVREIEL